MLKIATDCCKMLQIAEDIYRLLHICLKIPTDFYRLRRLLQSATDNCKGSRKVLLFGRGKDCLYIPIGCNSVFTFVLANGNTETILVPLKQQYFTALLLQISKNCASMESLAFLHELVYTVLVRKSIAQFSKYLCNG